MARPIIMTEEMKQTAQKDFAAMLDGMKLPDGKLNYSKSFKCKDSRAVVWMRNIRNNDFIKIALIYRIIV